MTHEYAALPRGELKTRRLELLKPLPAEKAFTEVREAVRLAKHDSFLVEDLQSSQL